MKDNWRRLDNVAKIFPSAMSGADNQVFRISCELVRPVDPALLSRALAGIMQRFDLYQCVMKRGLFWYYLESTQLTPQVTEESKPPCSALYVKNQKNLLFEVSYFGRRINLEVFHSLTDGTGALIFLKALVSAYLALALSLPEPPDSLDASRVQLSDDSFGRYYTGARHKRPHAASALQLRGAKYPEDRLKVITGRMRASELLAAAHAQGASLTVFLCACLMEAISASVSIRAKRRPVILAIPVDLRRHFPSKSGRNFFGVVHVEYNFSQGSGQFEDILEVVSASLKEALAPERLRSALDAFTAVELNPFARIAPLALKDLCLGLAYRQSTRQNTATLSNLGAVTLPEVFAEQVRAFDVMNGTNTLQVCVCSFGDALSVSFSSPLVSAEVQRCFFRRLTGMGLSVELLPGGVEDEEEDS